MARKKRFTPVTLEPSVPRRRWFLAIAVAILSGAALVAYHNLFWAIFLKGGGTQSFVLDDKFSITDNYSLHHLLEISNFFSAPANITRPLAQFTFALNYRFFGSPIGFHAVNLLIHIAAALALFGVLSRMLRSPRLRPHFGAQADLLALVIALLWAVHPLQTNAITYIVQRDEALMGLFFLLTLYCVIRAFKPADERAWNEPRQALSHGRPLWQALALLCCVLGMCCKQVMFVAPLVVFLYDYLFISGSFRRTFFRAPFFYLALAATCLIPLVLLLAYKVPVDTAGFKLEGFPVWKYVLTQPSVILYYLRLAIVPHPLCLDYGWQTCPNPRWTVFQNLMAIVPPGLIILALLGVTAWALKRRWQAGFAGVWLFLILAPSSSILPLKDVAFEHRMYLPLAAVLALAVLAAFYWGRRLLVPPAPEPDVQPGRRAAVPVAALPPPPLSPGARLAAKGALALAGALALTYIGLSIARNQDYTDPIVLWSKAIAVSPDNWRSQNNLGMAQVDLAGRIVDENEKRRKAEGCDAAALQAGKIEDEEEKERLTKEGIEHFHTALEWRPEFPEALNNLGLTYYRNHDLDAARPLYERALKIFPGFLEATYNLGLLFQDQHKNAEAIHYYEETLKINPDHFNAHNNLGVLLSETDLPKAIEHFRFAVHEKPGDAQAHNNLGLALVNYSQKPEVCLDKDQVSQLEAEALEQYDLALRSNPANEDAIKIYSNFIMLLRKQGRMADADRLTRDLQQLTGAPQTMIDAMPFCQKGKALSETKRYAEASEALRRAVTLKSDYAEAWYYLGLTYQQWGKELAAANKQIEAKAAYGEAAKAYDATVRLKPDYSEAHSNFGAILAELGQFNEAIDHFRAALHANPSYPNGHNNLGWALYREAKIAEKMGQMALAQGRVDDAHAKDTEARAKEAEALAEYTEALRVKPDYPDPCYNMGIVYQDQAARAEDEAKKKALTEQAIERFESALKLDPGHAEAKARLEQMKR